MKSFYYVRARFNIYTSFNDLYVFSSPSIRIFDSISATSSRKVDVSEDNRPNSLSNFVKSGLVLSSLNTSGLNPAASSCVTIYPVAC